MSELRIHYKSLLKRVYCITVQGAQNIKYFTVALKK